MVVRFIKQKLDDKGIVRVDKAILKTADIFYVSC